MSNLTYWECKKRLSTLVGFRGQLITFQAHALIPDRYSRLREVVAKDETGALAREQLNRNVHAVTQYLVDADCYPIIKYHEAPLLGGKTITFRPLENLYTIHRVEISYSVVIDWIERGIGYYEHELVLARRRVLNPFWWLGMALGAVIRIPFIGLSWAGFEEKSSKLEHSQFGKIYKLVAVIVTGLVALVSLVANVVSILGGLGIVKP